MKKYEKEEYVYVESKRYKGAFKIMEIESGFKGGSVMLSLKSGIETIRFFCHQVRYATNAEIQKSKLEKMFN
jgi:hypothetical protein